MIESSVFLADRLEAEGKKTFTFFAGLSPDQWELKVYTEGETWTIRNVLVHYVTAEKGFLKIFADIRDGGSGASEDFNIDRYNSSQQRKSMELTPAELLEQFQLVRAEMVAFVNSLSVVDLDKQGRHPFLGQTSLSEMVKMVYRHNQIHLRDLRKIIV